MSDNTNQTTPTDQRVQTGQPAPGPARVVAPGVATPTSSGTSSSGRLDDTIWSQIANEWLTNNMRNSPVANNAESWNHLTSQLDALRKIVEKYI